MLALPVFSLISTWAIMFFATIIKPGTVIKIYATPDNTEEEISLYGYMLGEKRNSNGAQFGAMHYLRS